MSEWTLIRRAVSIAGRVSDAVSGAPLGGALIAILDGPPAFVTRAAILAADPARSGRGPGLERAVSRPDGLYFFCNLPAGNYRLQIGAPRLGSRYGEVVLSAVRVFAARSTDGRLRLDQADAALPPTRISGRVTRSDTGQPVARARVRLRGDSAVAETDDDGRFQLNGLVAGSPTIEVTAAGFATFTRASNLGPGQARVVDMALTPA